MSIISPKKILQKRATIHPVAEKAIQPNSIDLTIKDAREILDGGTMSERIRKTVISDSILQENWFQFKRGNSYQIVFNEYVIVPRRAAAFIICRSSLNRMGAFITSGIYDSGFKNYIGATLRTDADITIKKGTRIATIYFLKAEASKQYDGSYQGKTKRRSKRTPSKKDIRK